MKGEESSLPSIDQLRWQCRRGMLELDILFESFLDRVYETLPVGQQRDFVHLLEFPDPLIMAWIMGDDSPEEPSLVKMIGLLRSSSGGYGNE